MRRALALGCALVATLTVTACFEKERPSYLPPPPPGIPAFYEPPEPLPDRPSGTVIATQPVPAITGAAAWRVLYLTTTHDGRRVTASGMVITRAGDAPASGRPIVVYAHGTTGVARPCAPSIPAHPAVDYVQFQPIDSAVPFDYGVPYLTEMIAAGYTVIAPDYQGLGAPGDHEYLVAASEAPSLIDAVRAARTLPETHAGADLVIFGYSQGGHAALAAGEDPTDITVHGVVTLAPVTDVATMASAGMSVEAARGVMFAIIHGYSAAYDLYPGFLTDAGADFDKSAMPTECMLAVTLSLIHSDLGDLITEDPTSDPDWAQKFGDNAMGNRRSTAPIAVFQGTADVMIGADQTNRYATRACSNGDAIVTETLSGADHATIVDAAQNQVLTWIANRFAGRPAPSQC